MDNINPEHHETGNMNDQNINIVIHHRGKPISIFLPAESTLADLSNHVSSTMNIPLSNQKFLIAGTSGMLKPPFDEQVFSVHPLSAFVTDLNSKSPASKKPKITLLGSTATDVAGLSNAISSASTSIKRPRNSVLPTAQPRRTATIHTQEDATYTFHSIRPLTWLPNPSRSQALLEKLASDAGIRAAMRKWKFSVGLLTEMDPTMHTTSESRTLGLNRNKGEVIELRLRTDAYDGYRDYKTIRKTLCHELTHNVWGDHDQNFWKLCREIERYVDREDWTRGGRSLGNETYYEPSYDSHDEEDHVDGGGWTGGEYVVGRNPNAPSGEATGLSRREIIARAAEDRLKKQKELHQGPGNGNGSGQA